MSRRMKNFLVSLCFAGLASTAWADVPRVVDVVLKRSGDAWRVDVTLEHGDTGWDHYADGWDIRAPDGTELGYRKLHHPHVNEQPFTRSLGGVAIPEDLAEVAIEASTNTGGWEGGTVAVTLER